MKHLFSITLFFICALSANSQISITGSQMPASGDTARYSNALASSVGNYTVICNIILKNRGLFSQNCDIFFSRHNPNYLENAQPFNFSEN